MRFRALGDALLATPLLRAVKAHYPEARVDYLVDETLAPLFHGNPDCDRVLAYPRGARWRSVSDLRWALKLRRERYDLLLDLQGSGTSALFTLFSGAPRRHGYRVRHRHIFYTEKTDRGWPAGRGRPYAPVNHFLLVESLGIRPVDLHPGLPPDLGLKNPFPVGSGPLILVAPGATWRAKQWPAAHYAMLIRALKREGRRVMLMGSPGERPLLDEIATDGGASIHGDTSIEGMVAALRHADLLLSTDSGARHVAVALGTPSLALFGPSDPAIWSVEDPRHPMLRLDLDCSPCTLTRCPLPGHPCMNDLTPDRVLESIRQLLAEVGVQ
jgi:ADP-heptose:LPS heptosyltransferase